jgi:hypothetical protein
VRHTCLRALEGVFLRLKRAFVSRDVRAKRALLISPLLVTVFVLSLVQHSHPANREAGTGKTVTGYGDPLSYIADRSPGEREGGALLSTKPIFGPQERVLPSERDREPAAGIPSEATNPVFGAAPQDVPGSAGALPAGVPDDSAVAGLGPEFFPGGGFPNVPNGTQLLPFVSGPGGSIISAVPEPASWVMFILGFGTVGCWLRAGRSRKRREAST